MKYDAAFFDKGVMRRGTDCEKWDDEEICDESTVPMWVADMDFPCAGPIGDAILARARHSCYGYTMSGCKDAEAFCDFVLRRHGLKVSPNQTLMLPCVVTGLRLAVRALTAPGDRVAVITPVYGPFFYSVEDNERAVERCPMIKGSDARYSLDFARLEEILRAGTKLLMLCSPHNPVSRVFSKEELQKVLALTRKYDAALVADEIHAEFVFAPHRFVSVMELADENDKVLAFMSASKTFNIAGLQQAMLVTKNAALMQKMSKEQHACGAVCGNIFALTATRAAYEKCDDWLDALLDYLKENIVILQTEVKRLLPKAVLTPVEATYLAWLDLRAYDETTKALAARCKKHGVAFTGGTFFGFEGEGYLRLNFGCPKDQLLEGVKRLADAMNE